jgi:hypothetical protein
VAQFLRHIIQTVLIFVDNTQVSEDEVTGNSSCAEETYYKNSCWTPVSQGSSSYSY